MSKPLFVGPDGQAIDRDEWERLWGERVKTLDHPESWWRKRTDISDDVSVSTVWVGLIAPIAWEAMIFGGDFDGYEWRYATRQEAFDDHERIVRALRAGKDPAPRLSKKLGRGG